MPSNMSDLDANHCLRAAFSDADNAFKMILSSATSFSIELSHSDGDSILNVNNQYAAQVLNLDNTATGIIVAEFSIAGASALDLYIKTETLIVGAQLLTLELSPISSGDVWIASYLTATHSLTAGVVVKGTPITNVVALRARVSIAAAITSGTFSVYAVGRA